MANENGQQKSLVMRTIEFKETVNAKAKHANPSLPNDIIFHPLDQAGDFHNWNANLIMDYIEANHHKPAKDHAVDILALGQTLVYEYGNEYPETRELTVELFLFLHDYLNCIRKEEEILFPKIKYLFKDKIDSSRVDPRTRMQISACIAKIREEQQRIYEKLKSIHLFTNDYSLPVNACFPYRYLFEKMKEFEANFLLHVYLEDHILFPKTLNK